MKARSKEKKKYLDFILVHNVEFEYDDSVSIRENNGNTEEYKEIIL